MSFRPFLLIALRCSVGLVPTTIMAVAEDAGSERLPPELAALLAAQPTWSASAALQTGVGYKDNLLLSSAAREESEFVRYAAEAFLWRLPRGKTDFSAFINAEQTRYFSAASLDDEGQAFAQLEWRYRLADTLKTAVGVQGYYLDQVFDVSDTEVQRVVAELKVRGVTVGPTVRWSFRPRWWFEAQALGKREKYDDGANDSRIGEGAVRLGWTGRRIELDVGAISNRRRFDHRLQYSFGGRPLDDTVLIVQEREAELRLRLTWGAAERWKTTIRAGELRYQDNGTGFFDYREQKVTHEVEWTGDNWAFALEGAAKRLEFDVQTVGFGFSPPARVKDDFDVRLKAERTFSSRWSAYLEYRWERSRSNESIASYRVNEGLLGVRWSWEK